MKYLKSFGHTIIIYTARRMKTHKGNTGKLMADIGKITFNTLEKFKIDPAISSSVFLTTATDVIGFFTFLGLSAIIIL